jgi:HAD superfamily phosphoserine phosphatase-like hydrolase
MDQRLSASMSTFIESVLRLQLKLAAFDCDGTLWSGDAGESFFSWEIKEGLIPDAVGRWARDRYSEYKAGLVSEEVMCGEMVTIHRGLSEESIQKATDKFFDDVLAQGIFADMQALVREMQKNGCEVWAVSSSNQWIIRSGMRHFGIPSNRILATEVRVNKGVVTDELIRIPSGPGKPSAIREVIARRPDATFGNSIWDKEMLEMAPHPFAVNPTPELEVIARETGWNIYFPEQVNARSSGAI